MRRIRHAAGAAGGGGLRRLFLVVAAASALALAVPAPAVAQEEGARALARVLPAETEARERGERLTIELGLSVPVPWRAFTLAGPPRLVLDFREVAWEGLPPDRLTRPRMVEEARFGLFRPGWSRLVLELSREMRVETAAMRTDRADGGASLAVALVPGAATGPLEGAAPEAGEHLWTSPPRATAAPPRARQRGDRPLVVMLDPGHGGIDPGAQAGGVTEAALMLTFARELREVLRATGRYQVEMTRDEDVFVSLQSRVSQARAVGADVFLSLHADALAEGRATGTTIYTLSETASDAASQRLAAEHDRADLLAGVDLGDQDDIIAAVLMDLARAETQPRSERLARALVEGIGAATGRLYKRPHLSAGFSVLRAPDIPSVLVELGFLSDPRDRRNLVDPEWRARAAQGILSALDSWAEEDAAEAGLLRQ